MSTQAGRKTLCLSVPAEATQDAIDALGPLGLIDDRFAVSPSPDGGRVLIPLTGQPEPARTGSEARLEQAQVPINPKLPPADRARLSLEDQLPEALLDDLPTGWQRLGDVAVVRLDESLADHGGLVGQALGQALGVRSVIELAGSHGELREPETRLLWGDPETRTVHREHGLVFHIDPAKVMFSAGNKHERHRLIGQVERGEQVVDLFAGIGYFTLPLARAGARVVACEKNPTSAGFLAENVEANDLADRVEIRQGDCRRVAPEGVADRVVLGYFPGTHAFLGIALRALKDDGGILHYHTTAEEPDALGAAERELLDHLPEGVGGITADIVAARRVKTYAPNVAHVVLDVEVSL